MYKFNAKKIPNSPGVYLFKDKNSNVIYVGKAKNLKHRVSSYFIKNNDRLYKKHLIVDSICDIETIVTSSEREALILESNLIKKYKPKYNVLLKDNSEYCFLKINLSDMLYIPEIDIVRRKTENDILNNKNKKKDVIYFGPYTSKKDLVDLLKVISKIFPYQCLKVKKINKIYKKNKNKKIILSPCFNYHIKRCAGICCGEITNIEYREIINNIISFFSGDIKQLSEYLNSKMLEFSNNKNYEQALKYRDKIKLLNEVVNKQSVRNISNNDLDILSIYLYNKLAIINIFSIVKGVLLNKKNFVMQTNNFIEWYDNIDDDRYKQDIITEFIKQNYSNFFETNKTIVVYDDKYIDKKQFNVLGINIRKYRTGTEKKLIDMGEKNCEAYINKEQINFSVLEKIQKKLNLNKVPKRIECFDISNIQGQYAVGSMSVFIDGFPAKECYRKFKIKIKNEPDDPLMMKEVLSRRLSYKNLNDWGVPDLIVLDGGITQLGAVLSLGEKYKILSKIKIVSLAKKEEEIFYVDNGGIKKVSGKDLYILRQIRDEAHRFGIGYFRSRYKKQFEIK
ncbi:MAG TPA: excinuclease ABC subunit UvrC [bacterium]|nr:excinuclease ABC subunit UvrC [bacterium]